MFTFYDDVDTIEEKAWNLCFNEPLEKFITFYSWVPSYSENIDNIFFSFDRDTSKYIAKIYADPSLIKLESEDAYPRIIKQRVIGKLNFSELADYKLWEEHIRENSGENQYVSIKYDIVDSPHSSLFELEDGNVLCAGDEVLKDLDKPNLYKLPIKITININYAAVDSRNTGTSSRTIYTTLALATPSYCENFKNTSFWKHGYAGLMETRDDILPTKWYGKQHPFEFEFIVAENQ